MNSYLTSRMEKPVRAVWVKILQLPSPHRTTYAIPKTDVSYNDDTKKKETVDLMDYGSKNENYERMLVKSDSFSKREWTIPLIKNSKISKSFLGEKSHFFTK